MTIEWQFGLNQSATKDFYADDGKAIVCPNPVSVRTYFWALMFDGCAFGYVRRIVINHPRHKSLYEAWVDGFSIGPHHFGTSSQRFESLSEAKAHVINSLLVPLKEVLDFPRQLHSFLEALHAQDQAEALEDDEEEPLQKDPEKTPEQTPEKVPA